MASRADPFSLNRDAIFSALLKGIAGKKSLFAFRAGNHRFRDGIIARSSLRPYIDGIHAAAAAAYSDRPVPDLPFELFRRFEETGDRSAFEAPYFERRTRLVALALSVWLRPDERRALALRDVIGAISAERTWALPAHLGSSWTDPRPDAPHGKALDLFACETAFAFAEIRALLGKSLHPDTKALMRDETERRVLRPFLSRGAAWPWEEMRNNWCAVCAGSIGSAALYLVDDDGRLADILARVLPSLGRFLESFPEDGACLEGLGYWTYGVGFFLSFSELLSEATAGAIDPSKDEKLSRIAAFQAKAYLNDSLAVSFADGEGTEPFRIGLAEWISRAYPDAGRPPADRAGAFSDDRHGRWCLSLRDLLWSVETIERPIVETALSATGETNAPSERNHGSGGGRPYLSPRRGPSWLPEAQWLLCPAGPGDGLAFAAKGGHNGEPHNHDDVGSFLLARGSVQFIADIGRGEYTKEYFGEGRYGVFCASSFGHSLPIIGGKGQLEGESRAARDVSCSFGREGARLTMDIARAYDLPALAALTRSFDFDGFRTLRLRDEYSFTGEAPRVIERFVTGVDVNGIDADGSTGSCRLAFPGGRLEIGFTGHGAGAIPTVSLHAHRTPDGRDAEIACVDYAISANSSRFAVEFEFALVMDAELDSYRSA